MPLRHRARQNASARHSTLVGFYVDWPPELLWLRRAVARERSTRRLGTTGRCDERAVVFLLSQSSTTILRSPWGAVRVRVHAYLRPRRGSTGFDPFVAVRCPTCNRYTSSP